MEIRVSESFGVKRVNYPSTLGYKLFDENEQCGLHGPNDGSVRAEKQILTKKKKQRSTLGYTYYNQIDYDNSVWYTNEINE